MEISEIDKVIIDSLEISENGLESIMVMNINDLTKVGVENIPEFLNGLLDAQNNKEFNQSSPSYIKGYKYGKSKDS